MVNNCNKNIAFYMIAVFERKTNLRTKLKAKTIDQPITHKHISIVQTYHALIISYTLFFALSLVYIGHNQSIINHYTHSFSATTKKNTFNSNSTLCFTRSLARIT